MDLLPLSNKIAESFKQEIFSEEQILNSNSLTIYEAMEVKHAFANMHWKQLTSEILMQNKAALNYFSDEAFIGFLPAYMLFILHEFERADVLVDILIEKLSLPSAADVAGEYLSYLKEKEKLVDLQQYYASQFKRTDDKIHNFIKQTALLSPQQCVSIFLFLDYLQQNFSGFFNNDEVSVAIYRYWFKFQANN